MSIVTTKLETISCKIASAILQLPKVRSGGAGRRGGGRNTRTALAWKKLSPPHSTSTSKE
ncbi:MAG: hypothetical protein A3J54_03915 [Candidatus Ryanbacteria bacterium RIFCSPHIGHO2_02_FULL_45_13b]|uniref:Uncharacterized protein n=1 Tax=Candidatus Ryanbacteria bacterium RIFCSPHIGHO2_02_FULL_45_13b TaxID=1802117 RepID=A0A1G2G5W6_9BACT|nr:MAG: hypothetical protein A3J54_03915 [Candidatus Ryanbacteria bacterium RIFCSPHIGHO2_02_FULL_45_13b]